MAKVLEYKTEDVVTLDNDGDEHTSQVTYAVVDEGTAGQEVTLVTGFSRVLRKGDVVVPTDNANFYTVYTAKEWSDQWSDEERVVESVSHNKAPETRAKRVNTPALEDQESDPDAPEKKTPAKKAAASSGSGS